MRIIGKTYDVDIEKLRCYNETYWKCGEDFFSYKKVTIRRQKIFAPSESIPVEMNCYYYTYENSYYYPEDCLINLRDEKLSRIL
jgi:hypothetical protein